MINNRYEIIKKLGEGRSSVFLCKDIEDPENQYAIKILPPSADENEKEKFINEYFILQKLEHPNINKAFEYGTIFKTDNEEGIETGSTYIILEHFEGEVLLLSGLVKDEANLREIVKQICTALYYLHQSKYIYYDLKPENILASLSSDIPQIRLIDLGLAEYSPSPSDYEIKGTAHYIAPELLKKEKHNHSVDFYSLGMIVYQIIYKKFPFEAKGEMEIYRSALENEFDYPKTQNYSDELLAIVKKLLKKDVNDRYSSALEIIDDLGFPFDIEITKEFLPANVFTSRENIIRELLSYIKDEDSSEVFSVRGFEGVGKSSLLHKVRELNKDAILISDVKGKSVEELIRHLLRQIIFSESVFPSIPDEQKKYLIQKLDISSKDIIDEFKSSIALISSHCKFTLLIDDFNLYDQLVSNLLFDVIPVLQVNNVNVIVSESSEHEFQSNKLNNLKEVTLGPFTGQELITFLDESFYQDFPREELKKCIIKNADLIPGNIKSFIKDLILFEILIFTAKGVNFSDEEDKLTSISEAHFAVYDLRLANLANNELIAAQIISAFDIYIDIPTLTLILGQKKYEIQKIITNLQLNNIIQKPITGQTLLFTSEALKKYIYASIESKRDFHSNLVVKLEKKITSFNRLELARQYELAGEYNTCYKLTMEEVTEAEKHSTFSYMQNVLNHIVQLPLKEEQLTSVKLKLAEVYLKLGDVQSALDKIKELKSDKTHAKFENNIYLIEGSALIASGEYAAGKNIIAELLKKIDDVDEKNRLKVELAYAEFELKNYQEAIGQCKVLLEDNKLSAELKGRCYNLMGMINIYQNNDLNSALINFENAKDQFIQSDQPVRISGAEVNIGNVYNILSKYEKAEEHWQRASKINQSIGNLEHEGMLKQNIGLFYVDRSNYEFALQSYLNAQKIFLSLGKMVNYGLILVNLGELYLSISEYEHSLKVLTEAISLFTRLRNNEEIAESLTVVGKLYFQIDQVVKLEETLKSLKEILEKVNYRTKYKINVNYLTFLLQFLKNKKYDAEAGIKISSEYKTLREVNLMIECTMMNINILIKLKRFEEAYKKLMSVELIELCSQNSILEAQREYFLGLISKETKLDGLLPPLVYFENAYELIKDEYITELTWKVLFEISELYIERGNLTKAKYFVTYTRELIYLIGEKIESPQLRAAYLRNPERMGVLKKLESFYPSN